ncbi:TPA: GNAT family N-acetyltransferase [Kluyvera cryocrescens]|uniref:GNAT family N-acetyltransferase n=1 Tax=Kluyvera cryocrescens TaxID=580 RepID=A0AAW9C9R7_KLUCR|nr:GNAT family N-acetyltransferase [Kluyvera cryocrescens]MCX2866106.1 GNAT family N-acetyltransferase [Kluyvera cryocrescens]MDW3779061.1 GNAT family N-acetyltransferase [Kluyvera cryocrescens]MEB7555954.1 GNAT family N-acetyltransferase [Kluyvera cryocrescens]MEB7712168.1 GNAT family N-acetyltransferase [Kluyvera cryocrescens]WNN70005.1 GNAT family N-acetyltransferase [Kluyvera cryocrescens]
MSHAIFRQATPSDIDRCFDIESTAYPADEAATREKIALRIKNYPQGFLCMEDNGAIIGFINAGCAWEVAMSDEDFKELIGHDPAAPNAVIMSVVLHPDYQGKGLSTQMMQAFIGHMRQQGKTAIYLMCKSQYLEMYKHFGYQFIKRSDSTHGGEVWFEMMQRL